MAGWTSTSRCATSCRERVRARESSPLPWRAASDLRCWIFRENVRKGGGRPGMRLLTLGLLLAFARSNGQEPPRLRVNVTLVQVDTVVTDREGHQVPGLTQDDFEIFEDGRPRKIRHFSYVGANTAGNAPHTAE